MEERKAGCLLHLYATKKFTIHHKLSLYQAAYQVLVASEDVKKVALTRQYITAWRSQQIDHVFNSFDSSTTPPKEPSRPRSHFKGYQFREESDIPQEKRAKIKNLMKKNGIEYTIHGIANAELYAVDLFWDIIVRYINYTADFPKEFFDDMIDIVEQEANHFLAWKERLEDYGYQFGYFPFQDGLWQSANETTESILSRLTVINLTHEAKGLDSFLKTKEKFLGLDDVKSSEIIDHNYLEEIGHVKIGVKWFQYICNREGLDPIKTFHSLSKEHFKGKLKEPFNHEARAIAGMTPEWYLPLADNSIL